jgi:hypothetical protein
LLPYQKSLVGLVVIDVELCRKNHDLFPANAIGRGLEPLDVKIDLQNQIKLVAKAKKHMIYFIYFKDSLLYLYSLASKSEIKLYFRV